MASRPQQGGTAGGVMHDMQPAQPANDRLVHPTSHEVAMANQQHARQHTKYAPRANATRQSPSQRDKLKQGGT